METFLDSLNKNSGALTVIFTGIVTLATVVYAVLTAALVKETRQMRQAQTEPRIDIGYRMRDEVFGFLDIATRNIGLGPAYNIEFSFSQVAGDPDASGLIRELEEIGFLRSGIKYLSPGQELKTFFTSTFERFEAKIASQISVKVTYKNAAGHKFEETFVVDLSELRGITRVGEPAASTIAKHIEKISRTFDGVAANGRLIVDVYTSEDRRSEQAEREARYEEIRARRKSDESKNS